MKRKKLQKKDETHDIGKLLDIAWKVYQNRDSIHGDRCQQFRRGDHKKSSNGLKKSTSLKINVLFARKRDTGRTSVL